MLIAWEYDFTNWKEDFIEYLKTNGIKPSAAKNYTRQVEKILEDENITIQKLSIEIDQWIEEYKAGKYADINKARQYAYWLKLHREGHIIEPIKDSVPSSFTYNGI